MSCVGANTAESVAELVIDPTGGGHVKHRPDSSTLYEILAPFRAKSAGIRGRGQRAARTPAGPGIVRRRGYLSAGLFLFSSGWSAFFAAWITSSMLFCWRSDCLGSSKIFSTSGN